jgi:hypothetical protein
MADGALVVGDILGDSDGFDVGIRVGGKVGAEVGVVHAKGLEGGIMATTLETMSVFWPEIWCV